ncbi:MAG: hypothetical protein Q4B58_04070 [Bacteroidales bacterium]|nr:hypothetical protein [Bacteroidales bacterium]
MKKLFVVFTALSMFVTVAAQNKTAKEIMAGVRLVYNKVQEEIKIGKAAELPQERPASMTIKSNENVAGIGYQEKTIELFFDSHWSETGEEGFMFWDADLYFARMSYNVTDRKLYWEFLYDKKGEPIFVYYRGDEYEGDLSDVRIYFEKDQVVELKSRTTGAKETKMYSINDDESWSLEARRIAMEIRNAFGRIRDIGRRD